MDIGIGLPTWLPGIDGTLLVDWSRRAEDLGFASLGALDRLMYDVYEPLTALAVAAGATRRIRLTTSILIAAYRADRALLVKQLASLDRLSGGRLTVGVAAGGRDDDYIASGTEFSGRGARLEEFVGQLRAFCDGGSDGPVPGPRPTKGCPPILFGGHSERAMNRAAVHGDGWIAGGSSASAYGELASRARKAWLAAGRPDQPRLAAIAYVALGGDAALNEARHHLTGWYAFTGWKTDMAVRSVLSTPDAVREFVAGYRAAGCDELILFPCVRDPGQADLIAQAALR
ncbi:LLM class flavin-dependent oxidoreductase [Spirillospora sp. NPDC049652]